MEVCKAITIKHIVQLCICLGFDILPVFGIGVTKTGISPFSMTQS